MELDRIKCEQSSDPSPIPPLASELELGARAVSLFLRDLSPQLCTTVSQKEKTGESEGKVQVNLFKSILHYIDVTFSKSTNFFLFCVFYLCAYRKQL